MWMWCRGVPSLELIPDKEFGRVVEDRKERTRINVDLGGSELYRAPKLAAAERGTPARQIVVEALQEWLERNNSALTAGKEGTDDH